MFITVFTKSLDVSLQLANRSNRNRPTLINLQTPNVNDN